MIVSIVLTISVIALISLSVADVNNDSNISLLFSEQANTNNLYKGTFKAYEAIRQSLHYALITAKKPKIVFDIR